MKKVMKWIAIIIAILIVLVIILPFVINVNDFRPQIESKLTNALGRKVTVGNLSLSLWSGSLAADNIAISDDPAFGNAPFVKAESLKVGVNLMPLIFSKKLEVRNITLTRPQVSLLRTTGGKWNFSTLGNSSSPAASQSGAAPQEPGKARTSTKSAQQKSAAESPQKAAPSPGNESSSEQSLEQNFSVG